MDSNFYTIVNMYRTIKQILGLPPLNQFDLAAEPMFTTLRRRPDFTPYTALPNQIPLDEMNPSLAGLQGLQRELAEFSLTIDSSEPDTAPADLLNRAIWHSVKGFDTPYNYGRPIKREGLPAFAVAPRGVLGSRCRRSTSVAVRRRHRPRCRWRRPVQPPGIGRWPRCICARQR